MSGRERLLAVLKKPATSCLAKIPLSKLALEKEPPKPKIFKPPKGSVYFSCISRAENQDVTFAIRTRVSKTRRILVIVVYLIATLFLVGVASVVAFSDECSTVDGEWKCLINNAESNNVRREQVMHAVIFDIDGTLVQSVEVDESL